MKKIMFDDKYGLTDAVLQGRKTMTRRIIPKLMATDNYYVSDLKSNDDGKAYISVYKGGYPIEIYPAYQIGEIVAVAQSYKSIIEESLNYALPRYHWLDDHIDEKGFENKMFVKSSEMTHQIRITDIKIERLQEISEEDCMKEGIYIDKKSPQCYYPFYTFKNSFIQKTPLGWDNARDAFAALIDKVSGKGTWKSNPWVFAYTFELVR